MDGAFIGDPVRSTAQLRVSSIRGVEGHFPSSLARRNATINGLSFILILLLLSEITICYGRIAVDGPADVATSTESERSPSTPSTGLRPNQ
jgi:hypothetical protein